MNSKPQKTSYLLNLPNEITVEILAHIKIKDICSVSLANRKFYKLLQDDYTWQLMCRKEYPQSRILEAQNDLVEDLKLKQAFESLSGSLRSSTNVPLTPVVAANTEHNELEWLILYKYLSNPISYMAKERGVTWLDCSDGPYHEHHWKTETGESDHGKIVFLNYVWLFDVQAKLKCVQAGTYDVIWRLKVHDEHSGLKKLNFNTQVLSNSHETSETVVQERNHVPSSWLFKNISLKGTWAEYRLPYQIIVPEERFIDGEYIWYDVRCKIYNHESHCKRRLSIDYVTLRHRQDGREYEVFEGIDIFRE